MRQALNTGRWPRLVTLIGIALTVVLGAQLRFAHLQDVGRRSPDESVYVGFAQQLATDGWPAMPRLFSSYLQNPQQWDYPPPTRLSTLALVSGVMGFTGAHDARAGVWVACAASVVSLVFIALLGWRWFDPATAWVATALMALSLTELAGARRCWQDTTLGAITLMTVYLTLSIVRQPRGWVRHGGFLALGVVVLLTKQTGLPVYALCAAAIAAAHWLQPRRGRRLAALMAAGIASLALAMGLLSLAAGGLDPAVAALYHSVVGGPGAQAYMAQVQSAAFGEFVAVTFLLDPFSFVMTIVGIGVLLQRAFRSGAAQRDPALRIQALLVVALFGVFFAFVGLYPGMQNLRFFSPATGVGYLLAAVGACQLVASARPRSPGFAVAVALLLATAGVLSLGHEYRFYRSRIVADDLQDLCIKWLHV